MRSKKLPKTTRSQSKSNVPKYFKFKDDYFDTTNYQIHFQNTSTLAFWQFRKIQRRNHGV